MPNADLIRTFAQTFGLPYTPARQNLPALADNCHLHLGKLADFYHHLDGTWQGENPRADYWLGMQTLFLQWLPYAGLPEIWHDWAFGWNNKAKQYLPIDGWREEWAVFGNMFDDSILFADTAAPNSPVYWLMTGYGTVAHRRLIAPSVAALMQTLLAIHRFEQEWQSAGGRFYDEAEGGKPEDLLTALHDLLLHELPPECAVGFEAAFWG